MKNYLLLLLLLSATIQAQIVTIPDPNFKNALVSTNCVGNSYNQFLTDADTNDDGEIQLTEALAVTKLSVPGQGITDLTGIEAFANIESLSCNNNALTTLTLNNLFNFKGIDCSQNAITNLSITNCYNLYSFSCNNNPMTSIDLSSTKVYKLYIANNPNLTYLNIKNGFYTDGSYARQMPTIPPPPPSVIEANPNLTNICCDDFEVDYIIGTVNARNPLTPVNVNSYCSSPPGGSFNTVTGAVTTDCNGANVGVNNQKIAFTNGSQSGFVFTNYGGGYTFYTGTNPLTVTPQLLHPEYFTVSPANYTYNFTGSGATEIANFCLAPIGSHPDLAITVYPLSNARPGFNPHYMINIANNGNQVQSGTVTFTYNGTLMQYVDSFPAASAWTANSVTWNVADLAPNGRRNFELVLHLNSPQQIPPANMGDVLNFQAAISSVLTDETPNDNQFSFNQTVVNSFDPNDKIVVEGTQIGIDKIDEYLHYIVRFQNTGTVAAENIVIKDLLDNNLDWSTLQMESGSHPFKSTLTSGNRLEVFYDNINLPASSIDEERSHGYIAYKIKPKNTLVINDVISNTANIYFDFNYPIITNTVTTTVTALGISANENSWFTLSPNPTNAVVNLSVFNNQTIAKTTVCNLVGQTVLVFGSQNTIDISSLNNGIYFITVETNAGKATRRIIKQ